MESLSMCRCVLKRKDTLFPSDCPRRASRAGAPVHEPGPLDVGGRSRQVDIAPAAYDQLHNANLVLTLRAWLDAFGDVPTAAAALYVHPNTFRYRLRRVAGVGEIDLTDPEARYVAMLQLRVLVSGAT